MQTGGAMGDGMPLAVGAAVAAPDRPVVALIADGCAMYTPTALWTQAREQLNVTTVILDNHSYAILRQEWNYYSRRPGTGDPDTNPQFDLTNPAIDFVRLAESFGYPPPRHDRRGTHRTTGQRPRRTRPTPHPGCDPARCLTTGRTLDRRVGDPTFRAQPVPTVQAASNAGRWGRGARGPSETHRRESSAHRPAMALAASGSPARRLLLTCIALR
ncbi:thiamine pyrophosphate-dependent enzyme [Micromonospora sp. BRA006-A]|nr:thiamine pyrophosphate-dependent enzyme [Micromonospora sp. BRA006-A]